MSRPNLRLDIQGLRALAVALVVVTHFLPAVVPGGYIGVDVFFVISGFLITAHLLREIDSTWTIKTARFWARRIRRLIPAAVLVLLASAAAILLLFPKTAWSQNLSEIGFAGFYVLNWELVANSVDYFAADNPASIVQHYWSLSVEEQFYLVWPLLMLVAVGIGTLFKKGSRRAAIFSMLVIVFIASFVASVLVTIQSQPSGYFSTTTRAWEFALGGLVAFLPPRGNRPAWFHSSFSWVAVLLVLGAAFLFGPETQFPGWIAMIPVAATAALIWLGDSASTWSPQFLSHSGPVQFLGDISYSVYLWHWPILLVYVELRGWAPGWFGSVLLSAIAIALAAATKYFVEDPIRDSRRFGSRPVPTFSMLAAAMAIVLAVALVPNQVLTYKADQFQQSIASGLDDPDSCFGANAILNQCEDPYSVTSTVNPEVSQTDTIAGALDMRRCERWGENLSEASCKYPGKDTTVMLYGDSHAGHLDFAVQRAAEARGWEMREETRSACSGFEIPISHVTSEDYEECIKWSDKMTADITSDPDIDIVAIGIRTSTKSDRPTRMSEAIREFLDAGKRVLLFREAPGAPDDIPSAGESATAPECVENADTVSDPCAWQPPDWDEWSLQAAYENNIPIADLRDIVCADGTCHTVIGGTIVYEDTAHFTSTFSKSLSFWVGDQLDAALTQ